MVDRGARPVNPDLPSPDSPPQDLDRSAGPAKAGKVRVFVIFDTEHDADLFALLRAQSHSPGCGFEVTGGSNGPNRTESGRAKVRSQIREADQAIIICGEHTEGSVDIHAEFLIAIDEEKPHSLLWGRRGVMCTKPVGAKPTDGIYSWTGQILNDQIAFNLRHSGTEAHARSLRRVSPGGHAPTDPTAVRDASSAAPETALIVR